FGGHPVEARTDGGLVDIVTILYEDGPGRWVRELHNATWTALETSEHTPDLVVLHENEDTTKLSLWEFEHRVFGEATWSIRDSRTGDVWIAQVLQPPDGWGNTDEVYEPRLEISRIEGER